MNYFFDHNNYQVVDRTVIPEEEIAYENVWGVADESLFTLVLRQIDQKFETGAPLFAHVMTTSNHRPYTYPDDRIDIPSRTSRAGAVKYSDFAIGKFLKEASGKKWFSKTIFVIVADHCASSAGATELPVNKYHIPLLIYSPGNITPGRVDKLMSQIDIAPTLLGLLNFNYISKFFGYDIFKVSEGHERAFISTYQSLGYLKGEDLVILSPQRLVSEYKPNFKTGSAERQKVDAQLMKEAIAWYQASSYYFTNGLYTASNENIKLVNK
jgi:phosphoglycerol transferase MdoB-like AlkP superfamily enzyme